MLIVIPIGFVLAFLAFCLLCVARGKMPRSPRIDKFPANRIVPRFILEYGYWILQGMMRPLIALRVSPDAITMTSLVFSVASASAFAVGRFALGGWLLWLSFIGDALDGLVARATHTSSDRGEFFDSLVDRYVDLVMFLGFLWYYRADPLPFAIAGLGLIGSSVMGYARAKGEALGIDPNVGFMQRQERAAIIGSLTVLSPVLGAFLEPGAAHPKQHLALFALAVVALFSNVTAIWRAHYVMSRMRRPPRTETLVADEREPAVLTGERGHLA